MQQRQIEDLLQELTQAKGLKLEMQMVRQEKESLEAELDRLREEAGEDSKLKVS
jgi:hypothetical protein